MNTPAIRILVVDDEPPLLRLMQTFLERLGYAVTACADSATALDMFGKEPQQFQILIADLTLAGTTGDVMACRMMDGNPELRVLLCSGYPFEVTSLPEQYRSRFAVLQKPFLPNMLTQAVADLAKTSG